MILENVFDNYIYFQDTMTVLKARGHTFPELKEADAMFTADTAPDWADGKVCNRCRVEFKFTQRKHHCRNCGQIFCGQCSTKQCPLPKYGIEKDVSLIFIIKAQLLLLTIIFRFVFVTDVLLTYKNLHQRNVLLLITNCRWNI